MTDPMTAADLDAIERDRLGKPRLGMEQRVREYARHLARPFADGVPDREGAQIASELLAALDGGE